MQYIKILQALLRLISDGLIFFSIIFVLAWVQGPLLLTAAAFMILLLFLYERFFRQILDQRSRTIVNSSVEVTKTVTESIEGLKEIKILGKEDFFAKNLKFNADLYAKSQILADLIRTQPKHIIELLFVLGFTSSIIFSSSLMNNFQSIVPVLGVFLFASIRLIPTLNQMLASVNVLRMGVYPTNLLYDDMHGVSDVLQKKNELSNSSEQFTSIELKNIFFSYNQDNSNQINNLNIKVERNKSIGLYGESGSGKTTLVDIMLGLLAPTSGQMFLNLQRVDNLKDFRKHVAYIPQDIFIINDSIKVNIALTNKLEDIDHDLLEDVIKRSRLKEVIKKLPEGIETNIGERGVKLSGGQKQRIAIARALYNKREVLIMDEATSALDNETEREIIEEIKKLKGKITMIVIAHRLTTLQHCDDIYEINSGKISERYSYEDIVKKN
jgi:ABC-type bacteriocin/lantibiotic exporter with double-glycine peptidase domain